MNDSTLLYRQIHPGWVKNGRVTSQAFKPTSKDEEKLSVYDGDMITAEESWFHYITNSGLNSIGVMAVSVGECNGLELSVEPETEGYFSEHAVVIFKGLSRSQKDKAAKRLRKAAEERDWQFNSL